MKITLDDLLFSLDVAFDVGEQYRMYVLPTDHHPRRTDDLVWICGEYLGKSIAVKSLDIPAEGRSVKAVCMAFEDDGYEIGLLGGMSKDEERFILCKEVFHVLLDRVECRNINLYDHVASTLDVDVSESLASKATATEELAVIAALEFLFPFKDRLALLDATEGEINFVALANDYNIPLRYIEHAFEENNVAMFREVMPMLERA